MLRLATLSVFALVGCAPAAPAVMSSTPASVVIGGANGLPTDIGSATEAAQTQCAAQGRDARFAGDVQLARGNLGAIQQALRFDRVPRD